MVDLISKYISAHEHACQLRDRQVALKARNQSLLRYLTLQRSHLSFALRGRADATRLSNVVAEQLAQTEASHEQFIAVHYSAVCGLRRDDYRKLLLDYHHAQRQLRRLQSSHRETQYKFQQLALKMAVGYVKSPPVPLEHTQVSSSSNRELVRRLIPRQVPNPGSSRPATAHLPPPQKGLSSTSPAQPHVTQAHGVTFEATPPPLRATKRARLPTALFTKTPLKQTKSKDTAPPPDLYYPPTPTDVPASNGEPNNRGKQPTPSNGGGGSTDGAAKPAGKQLMEVAASVHLIEKNIPHSVGQRKCMICGYADLLSHPLFPANSRLRLSGILSCFLRT